MLLPCLAPNLLLRAIELHRASASLRPLFRELGTREYESFGLPAIALYETELRDVLGLDDYSFSTPTREPFPLLTRQLAAGQESYAPQFVADTFLFSPALKQHIPFPILHHSRPFDEFLTTQSFVHELIHILQRVFRKHRVPTYPYSVDGRATIRNPDVYVQVGIEDELEVQRIMAAAGYAFSLKPVLAHRKAVTHALWDFDQDQATQIIRSGIGQIEFLKYDGLYKGNLRKEIVQAFICDAEEKGWIAHVAENADPRRVAARGCLRFVSET